MSAELFEKASRLKLRFATALGSLTVEDLWELPLTSIRQPSLDDVAKSLNRAIKEAQEESFVVEASTASVKLQLGFDIVKHVIDVRKAEDEVHALKVLNKQKKQKLLSLIAEKKDEQLKGSSVEELQAMVEAL